MNFFCLIFVFFANLVFAQNEKLNFAVLDFETQKISADDGKALTNRLRNEVQRLNVAVMERTKMNEILTEQGFANSELCNASLCAVEVGKMIGVNRVIVGSIAEVGSIFTVSARIVDVETTKILKTVDKEFSSIEQVLTKGMREAALELLEKKEPEVYQAGLKEQPTQVFSDETTEQETGSTEQISLVFFGKGGYKPEGSLEAVQNFKGFSFDYFRVFGAENKKHDFVFKGLLFSEIILSIDHTTPTFKKGFFYWGVLGGGIDYRFTPNAKIQFIFGVEGSIGSLFFYEEDENGNAKANFTSSGKSHLSLKSLESGFFLTFGATTLSRDKRFKIAYTFFGLGVEN